MTSGLWSRIRQARLVRVLIVYAGASWALLEVTGAFIEQLGLPRWFFPAAILLLLIGLVIVTATAWIQARPPAVAQGSDVPTPWEVDLVDLGQSVARGRLPHLTWARSILGGVFAFSLLFGFAGLYVLIKGQPPSASIVSEAEAAAAPGIAVLPFHVVGGSDLELWREGMVDLLSTNLDGAAGLRAIDPRGLLSRWRSEVGEGVDATDRDVALGVASRAGASYAVIGSAIDLGGGVRLTAEVFDLSTGDLLGRARVEGATDSVLALVDQLSIEVLGSGLVQQSAELPQLDVAAVTTTSIDALRAYLEGEQLYRRGLWPEAAEALTRAVEADSTFALAWYRLSLAAGWIQAYSRRSFEYSRRAASLSDRLPERVRLLVKGNFENDELSGAAVGTFEEMVRRYPDDVEGWYNLGEAYYHVGGRALRRPEESSVALARAVELDPNYSPAYIHLIESAFRRGDSLEVKKLVDAYSQASGGEPRSIGFRALHDFVWADSTGKERARATLDALDGEALRGVLLATFRLMPDHYDSAYELAGYLLSPSRSASERAAGYNNIGVINSLRGRMREATEAFAEETALEGDRADVGAAVGAMFFYAWDVGSIEAARSAAEVLSRDPSASDRFYLGVLAADEGQVDAAETQIEALEASALEREAEGNDVSAMSARSFAQALRVYLAIRAGDLERALAEREKPMPRMFGWASTLLRYELGKLLLERGDLIEAERFFLSLEPSPVMAQIQYFLGEVYERQGDLERARLRYARFVRWWEDADPELQPWWERGRQALERLTDEPRT